MTLDTYEFPMYQPLAKNHVYEIEFQVKVGVNESLKDKTNPLIDFKLLNLVTVLICLKPRIRLSQFIQFPVKY